MSTIVAQLPSHLPYTPEDLRLLNVSTVSSSFDPNTNYIEYTVTLKDNSFSSTNYNYNRYSFPTSGVTSGEISEIEINPLSDLDFYGFNSGEYISYYYFFKNELESSPNTPIFFIKDISADRTELTLNIDNPDNSLIEKINNFKSTLNNSEYFQDFYLNFGNNVLSVANNISINPDTFDILINLYSSLPDDIQIKNSLWIVTQIADSLVFETATTPTLVSVPVTTSPLKGPNFNLPIKDQTNNSTDYQTYDSLITGSLLSTSYSQLNSLISSSGIPISIDYTDFSNFVNFSSATKRINNFVTKVGSIQSLSASISYTSSLPDYVTPTINALTSQMNSIIENFDGYEQFLYYGTGSYSWPKSTFTIPYTLYASGSATVNTWLGSSNLDNPIGILGSASIYDNNNLDYLYNTIPNYLKNDSQNDQYSVFLDMIGHYYDNIWIYYKDVTNLYDADNRLDHGISKDLVANALKSFGVKLYQNNFSSNDLYSAFLGYGSNDITIDTTLPVTANSGLEYISRTISASYDASVTPLDDINKEVYKRLYHNLPYLSKTKGTIPGLRALINCFGVPDTILRISEFGGRDKDTSTYDYFDQKYNYGYLANGANYITSSFTLNSSWGANNNRPECIQFRIKPGELSTTNIPYSQSILILNTASSDISALVLRYTGSGYASASYSGSTYSASYQYANLEFIPRIGSPTVSASVYLPFYDEGWWSVMINRTSTTDYTLYAGNKLYYDGYDGNQIGFISSASITADGANNGGYSGNSASFASGSITIGSSTYQTFSGSIQEIRFWSKTGSVEAFKDFTMNPSSIDYTSLENGYSNYLAFRLPLGNELYTGSISVHPKVSGSWVTTSSFVGTSTAYISNTSAFQSNIESFFYDQPIVGIKNRVTDKIQIISSSYPTGSVLSQYRSLEQTYPTLGSETPDINLLEVAFSPQNEINNDIISSLGYFNIGEYIGDPRQASSSNYPDLNKLSNDFFQKYFASYNLFDYIRLIKYFDNSLFKMIQDFVPARTSLASGVVIKQHLLERSKYPQPQAEWEFQDYSGSIYSQQKWDEATSSSYTEFSTIGNIYATSPGVYDDLSLKSDFTQSWTSSYPNPTGLSYISHSNQEEFYTGELPGSEFRITNGELDLNNLYKIPLESAEIYDWFLSGSGGTASINLATGVSYPTVLVTNYTNPLVSTNTDIYTIIDNDIVNVNEFAFINLIFTASFVLSFTTASNFSTNSSVKTNIAWTRKDNWDEASIDSSTKKVVLTDTRAINSTTWNITHSITMSGVFSPAPGESYKLILRREAPIAITGNAGTKISPTISNVSILITQSFATQSVDPNYYANYDLFYNSDYNPTIDNADEARKSQFFMDVDYSQNPVTPVNQEQLITYTAVLASVQDSNYSSYAWSNIRYRGSRYNSYKK